MAMIFYWNGYRKLRRIRSRTQQKEKAMLKFFKQRIRNIIPVKRDQDGLELPVWLGKEARKSIKRLKAKMPKTNEVQLVTVSLKLLEQRWDIIVKRHARKRSRTLKKEGMNSQQIAEQLNKENFAESKRAYGNCSLKIHDFPYLPIALYQLIIFK